MTIQEWKDKGQYFNYKDLNIFCQDEGAGDCILLIHGFPTASWDWWQMWPRLSAQYRVLALDMIGFGFSDKPKKHRYSIFEQADLVEFYLKQKGIQQVHILCHDYGDTVGQELLARFNERNEAEATGLQINTMCFLNGGIFPETHEPLLIQKLLMSPIGKLIGKGVSRKTLGNSFKKIFGPNTQATETELDQFWALNQYNDGIGVTHLLIKYMHERKVNRTRWVGAMQDTKIPIRLIDGLYDSISGQNIVNRYKEIIPNPDVVELPDIGHFPNVEAPDLVLKHYLAFIS